MTVETHSMTDEEWEVYKEKAVEVYQTVIDTPAYLIAPILIKVLVSIHMQAKGLTEASPDAKKIHDNLQAAVSYALFNTINQYLKERN